MPKYPYNSPLSATHGLGRFFRAKFGNAIAPNLVMKHNKIRIIVLIFKIFTTFAHHAKKYYKK